MGAKHRAAAPRWLGVLLGLFLRAEMFICFPLKTGGDKVFLNIPPLIPMPSCLSALCELFLLIALLCLLHDDDDDDDAHQYSYGL